MREFSEKIWRNFRRRLKRIFAEDLEVFSWEVWKHCFRKFWGFWSRILGKALWRFSGKVFRVHFSRKFWWWSDLEINDGAWKSMIGFWSEFSSGILTEEVFEGNFFGESVWRRKSVKWWQQLMNWYLSGSVCIRIRKRLFQATNVKPRVEKKGYLEEFIYWYYGC